MRVRRGADAGSDHHLLIAKARMKLRRCYTPPNPRVKYNVRFLKDSEIRETLKIMLLNSYQALHDLDREEEWNEVKEALINTYEEVLGRRKLEHKEWISPRTLDTIKKRKAVKEKCNRSRTRQQKVESQKL